MKTSTDFFQIFCAISVHKKAAKKHPAQGFGKNYLMTTHSTVHSRECMAGGALNYSSHLTFTKVKEGKYVKLTLEESLCRKRMDKLQVLDLTAESMKVGNGRKIPEEGGSASRL